MKKLMMLCAAALLLWLPSDAFGQRRQRQSDDYLSDRQRIRRGVRSGRITREEARLLRLRERELRARRRSYRSDGTLTREELRSLRRDERRSDRQIRRYRRNGDRSDYHDGERRRGNGYYRRGAGSESHPVFGTNGRNRGRNHRERDHRDRSLRNRRF